MELTANNLVEAVILNRHSVRAFTNQAVDPEIIQDLLRKASYA
ncbi:nitroreductase family protein, partial [Acinetobacter sp.]